jgi:nitrilase
LSTTFLDQTPPPAAMWELPMTDRPKSIRVAAAQISPVFLDREATVDKAIEYIALAAKEGANLIAFGEAWLPGYPWWIYLVSPIKGFPFAQRLYENAVEIPSRTTDRLCKAARDNNICVVIGLTEKDRGSLYLAQLFIDAGGSIIGHRRKLKPTHNERAVWGEGDGSDIIVVKTEFGNLGALNCWEHLQPLTRFAMNYLNEQIHVSAWPGFSLYTGVMHSFSAEANLAASRSYALETQTFVIHVGPHTDADTVAMLCEGDEHAASLLRVGGGYSEIIDPNGKTIGGPLEPDAEGLVFADCDLSLIGAARMANDPAGHYARADVTQLVLNRSPRRAVVFRDVVSPGTTEPKEPEEERSFLSIVPPEPSAAGL